MSTSIAVTSYDRTAAPAAQRTAAGAGCASADCPRRTPPESSWAMPAAWSRGGAAATDAANGSAMVDAVWGRVSTPTIATTARHARVSPTSAIDRTDPAGDPSRPTGSGRELRIGLLADLDRAFHVRMDEALVRVRAGGRERQLVAEERRRE